MMRWLASAKNQEEVSILLNSQVDIIDLKNPEMGALGALSHDDVAAIVRQVGGQKVTSATIGDLEMDPIIILPAILSMAETGVDIVKIGFFGSDTQHQCVDAVQSVDIARQGYKLVAVILADHQLDMSLIPRLAQAGFYGVMLDTAKKDGRSLTDHLDTLMIQHFVDEVQSLGMIAGLAGSLKIHHVDILNTTGTDYLGFRGALCESHQRESSINQACIDKLQRALHKNNMSFFKTVAA